MVFGKKGKTADEQAHKKTKVKQPVADDGLHLLDRREKTYAEQQNHFSLVFWGVVSVSLLTLSISLILLGNENHLPDLIILGSIFLVAAFIFLIVFLLIVCKPIVFRCRNRVTPEDRHETYDNRQEFITKQEIEKQRRPTAFMLYGEDKIIHEPSGTVLPDPEFPLPPMVCLPNMVEEEGDHAPVVKLPLKTDIEAVKEGEKVEGSHPPLQSNIEVKGTEVAQSSALNSSTRTDSKVEGDVQDEQLPSQNITETKVKGDMQDEQIPSQNNTETKVEGDAQDEQLPSQNNTETKVESNKGVQLPPKDNSENRQESEEGEQTPLQNNSETKETEKENSEDLQSPVDNHTVTAKEEGVWSR